jgi:ABC-type sugar transport system substrate-binding protein
MAKLSHIFALCLVCISLSGAAATPLVIFVSPGAKVDVFWKHVNDHMQAAADSLDITLEVIYSDRSSAIGARKLSERLNQGPLPGYVIFTNGSNGGRDLLKVIEPYDISVSFVLEDISIEEKAELMRDPHWQKYLLPGAYANDYLIGFITSRALIDAGQQKSGGLFILSGARATIATKERESGVFAYVSQSQNIEYIHREYADWSQDLAYRKTKEVLNQHQNIRYIWTSNDQMALGAIKATTEQGLQLGKDVFISSINTSQAALTHRRSNIISVLAGGHFAVPSVALLKVAAHSKGKRWNQRTKFILFSLLNPNSTLFTLLEDKQWNNVPFEELSLNDISLRKLIEPRKP